MTARLRLESLERRMAPAAGPVQQVAPIATPVSVVPDPSVPPDGRAGAGGGAAVEAVPAAQVAVFLDLPQWPLPDPRIGRFAEPPYIQTPPATPGAGGAATPVEPPSVPVPPEELVWTTPEEEDATVVA